MRGLSIVLLSACLIPGFLASDDRTGGICRYGSTEYYVRISSCLEWIHGAIGAGG